MKLTRGGSDLLEVCESKSATSDLIRSYLVSQGDHVVHFSSDVTEQSTLDRVPRWLVLTDRCVLCIPKSALETGIFFDCRTNLDQLSQVVVDDEDGGPTVSLMLRPALTGESMIARMIAFASAELRKMFLLSLCIARPSLPILQRRKVDSESYAAPTRATPAVRRHVDSSSSPAHPQRSSESREHASDFMSPAPKAPSLSAEPIFDIADDVFSASRDRLREILSDSWGDCSYDADRAASRPPEEDPSRTAERDKIKADLDHRERKIIQNIEFKLKYPTKPATKVQPGVEYDKAHEERLTLPDDLTEDELLGPSLFSLWQEWKRCNGLMGHENAPPEWTLYSSNELVAALHEKEEELYGFVGPRSLRKVRTMRELVARERLMYLNSKAAASPARQRSSVPATQPKPFTLSQSPFSSLKAHVKILEKNQLVSQMKEKYESHVKSRHELHKQHLQRQLQRLSLSPEK